MKAILLMVLLTGVVAQVFPSCGGGSDVVVIGWVDAKMIKGNGHILVINQVEYTVDENFWYRVEVGDLVKYENGVWSIVKKAGT